MLKNNIEIDVKVKCVEEQITQAELAEKTGTSPSYVNRLIKKPEKIVICRGETERESFHVLRRKYDVSVWRKTSGLV